MIDAPVVVVGGGAAGLAAAGALTRRGVEVVVLERDEALGGSWARRYDRLRLHTIRVLSGLPHGGLPRGLPRYVSKEQYAAYLRAYAERLGLRVELGWQVERVWLAEGGGGGRRAQWRIEGSRGGWRTRVVVIATGQYAAPLRPRLARAEEFSGKVLHAVEYRTGRNFAGKRVLVVGSGNTGTEIAVDLVEHGAAGVALSVRAPPFVVPRDLLGVPVQVAGMLLAQLPARLADAIARMLSRLAFGDMRRYGLASPGWSPFAARRVPTIDVGFVAALKAGRLELRPNVVGFTERGVRFAGPRAGAVGAPQEDGRDEGDEEAFDAVILATGYTTGLERLLDVADVLDENGVPRYRSGEPTLHAGLYFLGYTTSLRGHLFETARDAERLARNVERYLADG